LKPVFLPLQAAGIILTKSCVKAIGERGAGSSGDGELSC